MASVTIAGVSGQTSVEIGPEGLAAGEVLKAAAESLGFTSVDLDTLAPVVNGEDVSSDAIVQNDDVVAAAPAVENGALMSLGTSRT